MNLMSYSFMGKRYGYPLSSPIQNAWTLLWKNPYSEYKQGGVTKNAMVKRPGMNLVSYDFMGTDFKYDPTTVEDAWAQLLSAKRFHNSLYRYDIVDFGRQVLSNKFLASYKDFQKQVAANNTDAVVQANSTMLGLMDDLDDLLSCDKNWMLGPWLERAKSWGDDPRMLEFNARNQITLWGPTGQIDDYASKQWSGLVKTYYRKRWALYFEMLIESKTELDMTAFQDRVFQEVELPWQYDLTTFPTVPSKDLESVACKILAKYTKFSCQ